MGRGLAELDETGRRGEGGMELLNGSHTKTASGPVVFTILEADYTSDESMTVHRAAAQNRSCLEHPLRTPAIRLRLRIAWPRNS